MSQSQICYLDCSPEPADKSMTAEQVYLAGHYPGARFLKISECVDKSSPYPNMMPPTEQFIDRMKELGIGKDTHVVTFDNTSRVWASRAAFLFDAFGHPNVQILDEVIKGGSEVGPVAPASGTDFSYSVQKHLVAAFEDIVEITKGNAFAQLLDARPVEQYN